MKLSLLMTLFILNMLFVIPFFVDILNMQTPECIVQVFF